MNYCNTNGNASGILTPIVGGKRVFYDINKQDFFAMEYNNETNDTSVAVGRYLFSSNAFQKASAILCNATSATIIIDEIGPLELNNQGFSDALKNILVKNYSNLLLVVRDSLVNNVINHFSIAKADVIYSIDNYKQNPNSV